MDAFTQIFIAIVVVAAIAAVTFWYVQHRQRTDLQRRFGPEYDRAVSRTGDRRQAESELSAVAERREALDIHPLDEDSTARYVADWQAVQARFVDEPAQAVLDADTLLTSVLHEQGYPVADFDQRASLVATDHPEVVQEYRAAREALDRHLAHTGTRIDGTRDGRVADGRVDGAAVANGQVDGAAVANGQLDGAAAADREAGDDNATEDLRQAFMHYRALFEALVEHKVQA